MNQHQHQHQQYIDSQKDRLKYISTSIIPLRPDIGHFIEVNGGMPGRGIEVSEKLFPEEFAQIKEAFLSVIEKLQQHKL